MTITKLLGSVAVAALIGSGAQAQIVITSDTTTEDQLPLRVAASSNTEAFIAAEFQPSTALTQLAGNVVITTHFGTTAPYAGAGVSDRVRLTVSVTNGTWTSATGGTASNAGTTTQLTNCGFDAQPVAGGGVGNDTVEFLSTAGAQINGCTGISSTFAFNGIRRVNNNAPVVVTFSYAQVDSTGGNPGAATAKTVTLADTASVWGTDVTKHKFVADSSTDPTSGTTGILTASSTTIGTVQTSFRTQASAGDVGGTLEDIREDDGTTIVAGDVFAGGSITIDFPQGADGISAVTLVDPATAGALASIACTGPVPTTAPAARATCTLDAAALGTGLATKRNIVITKATPAVATPEQTPTATLAVLTQSGYVASGYGPTSLRALANDDGRSQSTNVLTNLATGKWTAFGTSNTESQFRISGLSAANAAKVEAIRIEVADGGNGVPVAPAPGYYSITASTDNTAATGFVVRGGTIVFNSKSLGLASGATGNADIVSVKLRSEGTALTGATINRQLTNRNPTSLVAVPAD
jgi:hypothetical protein